MGWRAGGTKGEAGQHAVAAPRSRRIPWPIGRRGGRASVRIGEMARHELQSIRSRYATAVRVVGEKALRGYACAVDKPTPFGSFLFESSLMSFSL
jgi:hypothetical protein